ncbi:MAG: RagB/SusD family nutrient uptake outer membrane protein [Chitinophagaceae bacterium]|nr:MAG: RagB/SusD family nutrient uptake outer membrane protein [Chitinophagaceae bacterium]
MKFYKYIGTIFIIGTLCSSCKRENFLNRFPQDALSQETFFKSENDLKLFCNQFYSSLPTESPLEDNNSDNLVPRSPDVFLSGQYTVPVTGGGWSWSGIRNCNYFLANYESAQVSDSIKNIYKGEDLFFRALYYWQLVEQFGDVPYISHYIIDTSNAELYAPRTPRKEVMDSVLTDLNFAVTHLPLPQDAAPGRLNKYCAEALKARICLWAGTYREYHGLGDQNEFLQEAVNASQDIINSGQYSIYTTGHPNQDYYNLFVQQNLSTNPEAIMAATYIPNVLTHNLTRTLNEAGTGWSQDFINSFLCTDGLPIDMSPSYKGDDSISETAKNRDPRLMQMVATPGTLVLSVAGSPDTLTLPRIGTNLTSTGYEIIKMKSHDPAQWNANQSDLGLFIFRYAETLLVYAEAKAELANEGTGSFTQADLDISVNLLRDRVGMPHMLMTVPVDPAMASKFPNVQGPLKNVILEIRRERRVELAGEGFRFDDLMRWKAGPLIENPMTILGMKLVPSIKAQYPPSQVSSIPLNPQDYIEVYPSITSRTWNDKMYLYPIPIQEITLNPKIQQNPGW